MISNAIYNNRGARDTNATQTGSRTIILSRAPGTVDSNPGGSQELVSTQASTSRSLIGNRASTASRARLADVTPEGGPLPSGITRSDPTSRPHIDNPGLRLPGAAVLPQLDETQELLEQREREERAQQQRFGRPF